MKKFKVIEIIDINTLLINYGKKDGAEEGNKIRVLSIGDEVVDPYSNEVLGTLDTIKAVLTIETVYDKFSLCRDSSTTFYSAIISPMNQFQKTSYKVNELNVSTDEISNKKLPSDKIIHVGDVIDVT